MTPTIETPTGEVRVHLPRDLDSHAAVQCGAQVERALSPEITQIVFVCADVLSVDTVGLRFLLESERRASAAAVGLVLARPTPILLELIALAGFAGHLRVERFDTSGAPLQVTSAAPGHGPHWFPVPAPLVTSG